MSINLGQRVWDYSTSRGLLHSAARVVVGVSGGPDSLCLLDVLYGLAPEHGLQLHVAHLDHGLRAEAAAEADFVRQQAELRGLPYYTAAVDVGAQAAAQKQSLEAAARAARYAFLTRIGQKVDATVVAVGHTADDQAETVLMHLLRGSGTRGLRGMQAERLISNAATGGSRGGRLRLVRPLLEVERAEVMSYCAEHNLTPTRDSSNLESRFFRNRLRNELLPILQTYNPNIRRVLRRTAEVVAGDYQLLQDAIQKLWSETVEAGGSGEVIFNRANWLALGVPQQRALLRQGVGQLLGGWQDIDFAPLHAAVLFSRRCGPGRSCQVVRGLRLVVQAERLRLVGPERPDSSGADAASYPRLAASGGLEPGWQLDTVMLGPGEWTQEDVAMAPRWTAYVDASQIHAPLRLRSRLPGDRFQPLGMAGHSMRLAEFLINERLPAGRRDRWPLLVCRDDIVWVAGLRLDERFKVTAATQTAVRVSFRPDGAGQL